MKQKCCDHFNDKTIAVEGMGVDQKPSYEGAKDPKSLKHTVKPNVLGQQSVLGQGFPSITPEPVKIF